MDGEGKFFFIRSRLNEFVLTIRDNNIAAGTDVIMFPSHGGPNQLWYEDRINSVIRNKHDDNLVLDIQDDKLVVSEFQAEEYYQHWKIAGEKLEHAEDGSRCIDITGANDEMGAELCCYEFNGDDHQLWDIEYRPAVRCYIRNKANGKVLDIRDCDASPGAKIIIYDCGGCWSDNQTWYEDKYGIIRSCLNDFVFDSCETRIIMNEYDCDVPTRGWIKAGDKVARKDDPTLVLAPQGGGDKNKTKVDETTYTGEEFQKWIFEYQN